MRIVRVCAQMATVVMGLSACSQLGIPGFPGPREAERPAARPGAAAMAATRLCVVDASAPGGLRTVDALRDGKTGETYVVHKGRRRPLSEVYPAKKSRGYARSEEWFRENESIRMASGRYLKYGPERSIPASKLKRGSAYAGIPLFLDPRDSSSPPSVLYVPSRPGCVFQPYLRDKHAQRG